LSSPYTVPFEQISWITIYPREYRVKNRIKESKINVMEILLRKSIENGKGDRRTATRLHGAGRALA